MGVNDALSATTTTTLEDDRVVVILPIVNRALRARAAVVLLRTNIISWCVFFLSSSYVALIILRALFCMWKRYKKFVRSFVRARSIRRFNGRADGGLKYPNCQWKKNSNNPSKRFLTPHPKLKN